MQVTVAVNGDLLQTSWNKPVCSSSKRKQHGHCTHRWKSKEAPPEFIVPDTTSGYLGLEKHLMDSVISTTRSTLAVKTHWCGPKRRATPAHGLMNIEKTLFLRRMHLGAVSVSLAFLGSCLWPIHLRWHIGNSQFCREASDSSQVSGKAEICSFWEGPGASKALGKA